MTLILSSGCGSSGKASDLESLGPGFGTSDRGEWTMESPGTGGFESKGIRLCYSVIEGYNQHHW